MEAKAKSFNFIGNESLITVPFFQRTYVWKKENWEDLLTDLLDADRSHFLGSVILKQLPPKTGEVKQALVIDGQQRLTTLSVMLKALYDSFSEETQESSKESIRQCLFYKKSRTDRTYYVKLEHSHADAAAYRSVIRYNIDDFAPVAEKGHRIFECYRYFLEEFRSRQEHENTALLDQVLDDSNKSLVVIDLHPSDDEQAIFDTINSAGVRLSAADIIKNALFQKVINLSGEAVAIAMYTETWRKSFLFDGLTIRFWETQRVTGRLLRDNLEILLHSVAVINNFYDPERHTLGDLSRLYKQRIDQILKIEELRAFLDDLCEYADLFKSKIKIFDKSELFSFAEHEKRLFHVLNTLEVSAFHPYILYLYKAFQHDSHELISKLFTLEQFVIRSFVSKTEMKSFSKMTKIFITNPLEVERRNNDISDVRFKDGLLSITNKLAALLLFWIELKRRHDDPNHGLKDLKYDYTLEHIMPQKWEQYWKALPQKNKSDGSIMSAEEAKSDRYDKIYWIGNMTLLTSSLNISLRNHGFQKKMEGEGKRKGIAAYGDLSITNMDLVLPYYKGDVTWDENKISTRTDALSREIITIWS